jgi:tRNA(fMet)-specific endonuclease VapC
VPRLFLLDTNIIVAAIKGRGEVRKRLDAEDRNSIRLSSIVLGELEFGAEKSTYGDRNRAKFALLVESFTQVGIDADTAREYGRIRAFLERSGLPIGSNDTWIAAQALTIGATMVTDNRREFDRVPGLRVETWLTAPDN